MKLNIYIPQRQIKELEKTGNKIIKELNKEKTRALLKAARKVRKRIKQKAPRGPTGNLKKAVYAKALPASIDRPTIAFVGVRARRAPHAHLVEFGHAGPHPAPPHPFLRPAWDSIKDEIKRDIAAAFKKSIMGGV